ncbi:MAG: DNA mismatch repair protein MutS, partial [Chlorobi bacterium]|nr:DNA mismatch repair protein MutS [Chlorobiota bacterium]
SFNNPEAEFPQVKNSDYIFKAEELGHPLIPKVERVDNEVGVKVKGFSIITGANMAGKSTYLRTIGVNLILGMIGAPVCGRGITISPIQLYTSIRTDDSLQKNESYFYSELKRLKAIIDELKKGTKLFIILDEILRGTNSKDKHAGSEALLKQLIDLKASGIIATHDVALGNLEKSFPEHIKNRCFEVDINGSVLSFDYKLRDGVSKNMNATILMREMGITV